MGEETQVQSEYFALEVELTQSGFFLAMNWPDGLDGGDLKGDHLHDLANRMGAAGWELMFAESLPLAPKFPRTQGPAERHMLWFRRRAAEEAAIANTRS